MTASPVLDVQDLTVTVGERVLLDRVSFSIERGRTMGLVGESGSGKSLTSLAMMGLLPVGMKVTGGAVHLDGVDLLGVGPAELRDRRGNEIAMIFQEPMTALNPAFTVGDQIGEVLRRHRGMKRGEARKHAVEALSKVGIPAADKRSGWYPHEFSGGMRQRVMIAMAIVCEPKLLIADEPTTALDTTVQAQVLDLLHALRDELGMAMVFITHDMAVVAEVADSVTVLYSGEVVERAPVGSILRRPRHPYSKALLEALPHGADRDRPLATIPGRPPDPGLPIVGCRFAARCPMAIEACTEAAIALEESSPQSAVRCIRAEAAVPA